MNLSRYHTIDWKGWRRSILGTLGAIGVWIAAVVAVQPDVTAPALPVEVIGPRLVVVTNDYRTRIGADVFTIRAGFKSDLASIPPCLTNLLGIVWDSPTIRRAALCHDADYAGHLTSREHADADLYAGCIADGMVTEKALAVRDAVASWGFLAWDAYTPEQVWSNRQFVSVTRAPPARATPPP